MKFSEISETIKISFEAMNSNKIRSGLASLGVVIGISVVIMMGWVLDGLDSAMTDTFNILGTDMLYVDKWDWSGGKSWKETRQRKPITMKQVELFQKRMKNAEIIYPEASQWFGAQIKYNKKNYQGIQIVGTTSNHGLTSSGDVIIGRHISLYEDEIAPNIAVIGYGVYENIFNKQDPIGEVIKIDGHKFTVIGVLRKQGTVLLDFIDNRIYIPLNTFTGLYGKIGRSFQISIKTGQYDDLEEIRAITRGIMREIRKLGPYEEDDFSINSVLAFEEQVATIRLYVWGVGIGITALSFLVGIIGIMNIMFVSVTERTKEIGIRKAVGAKKSSILLQFLIESATLSFVGAIISLIFCSLIVFLVSSYLPNFINNASFLKPYLPLNFILISSFVSIFVGILAGIIPAFRAANLNPIDALRFE